MTTDGIKNQDNTITYYRPIIDLDHMYEFGKLMYNNGQNLSASNNYKSGHCRKKHLHKSRLFFSHYNFLSIA